MQKNDLVISRVMPGVLHVTSLAKNGHVNDLVSSEEIRDFVDQETSYVEELSLALKGTRPEMSFSKYAMLSQNEKALNNLVYGMTACGYGKKECSQTIGGDVESSPAMTYLNRS